VEESLEEKKKGPLYLSRTDRISRFCERNEERARRVSGKSKDHGRGRRGVNVVESVGAPSNPVIHADLDFDHTNDQSCFRNLPSVASVADVPRCDVIL
jgi:hypothetical protein